MQPESAAFEIRKIVLPTKYGDVFCLQSGQYGQPLLLVIHGSGPTNSSSSYDFFLYQYNVRVSYLQKFYILAIDCPGYGKSTGSKEAIKTFPLELLRQILVATGYKQYFALMGHSQGGAAIFNAVFEDPSITEIMLQDRPVCGNIQRFNKFPTPTLLIYDIQDDGHPIWQGKQLYKQLKNSELYTYRSSRTPFWIVDNLWDHILQFMGRWCQPKPKPNRNARFLATRNSISWRQHSVDTRKQKTRESVSPVKQRKGVSLEKPIYEEAVNLEEGEQDLEMIYQAQIGTSSHVEPRANRFAEIKKYQQPVHPFVTPELKPQFAAQINQEVTQKKIEVKPQQKLSKPVPCVKPIVTPEFQPGFAEKPKPKPVEGQQPVTDAQKQEAVKPAKPQGPEDEFRCSLCLDTFFKPAQIDCKHIFCWKCITQSMLIDPRCPLCRRNVQNRKILTQLHQRLASSVIPADSLRKRQTEWSRFERMIKSIVFVEVGNTSALIPTKSSAFTKTKKKYNWQLFAVEPRNFKFQCVDFNINMGEPMAKPVRVKQAPFSYQNRSTFSFSCEITIYPKSKDYPPLVVVYRINIEQGRHSKKVALKKKSE